jgi:integrase
MTALQSSINWGVDRELIEKNPISKIKSLQEHDSEQKVRYLKPDERKRLFAALDKRETEMRAARESHNAWLAERGRAALPELGKFADYFKPLIIVALYTGIRRGDIFGLQWCDIDFNAKTITLRASKTKSGKMNRIPMNSLVYNTLDVWKQQNSDAMPAALVFPSPKTGKRFNNCNSAWESLLKEADIQNFRWHDMRHDFASQLVMSGVDLNTVRELLGHADLKMTLRYAHLAPSAMAKAVEKILDSQEGNIIPIKEATA